MKWRFPDSAVISANGYYLVYCSGKDKLQANGIPHTNFSISAEMETLVLSDASGRLVDRVSIENVPADYSVGRDADGNWTFYAQATPGMRWPGILILTRECASLPSIGRCSIRS